MGPVAETLAPPSVALPWGAWYGDSTRTFPVPERWTLDVLRLADAPPLSDAALEAALDAPVGSGPLQAVARGARSVAIAIDDLTRPTRTERLVSALLRRLNAAGVEDRNIAVVIASGAH